MELINALCSTKTEIGRMRDLEVNFIKNSRNFVAEIREIENSVFEKMSRFRERQMQQLNSFEQHDY